MRKRQKSRATYWFVKIGAIKMRCVIFPGSMGAVMIAIDIFGKDRVDAGNWLTPVYVDGVKEDEFQPAKELLTERGLSLRKA